MLNGAENVDFFTPARASAVDVQEAFADSGVQHGYLVSGFLGRFHSKYEKCRKGLKGSIKLETSKSAFFCRAFPLSLWGGSLLALAWGGALCQLAND